MRMIEAKELERQIKEVFKESPVAMGIMLRWIRKQPTIDPESLRPKGRWVYDDSNLEWACSECLRAAPVNLGAISGYILSDFCPNCGAKMEG